MAIGAFCGCGLIKYDILAGHRSRQHVAPCTWNILVRALKREGRAAIVVKGRGLPAIDVVTARTIQNFPPAGELPGMRIVMATGTLYRGLGEVHMLQSCFQCRRPVAIGAGYGSMGTQ
jgi:hypothetical protein